MASAAENLAIELEAKGLFVELDGALEIAHVNCKVVDASNHGGVLSG